MSGMAVTENEDIVKVDEDKRKRMEEGIHYALERLSSIFKTKRHEVELEETEWGDYCHLGNVVCGHWNLIISFFQV